MLAAALVAAPAQALWWNGTRWHLDPQTSHLPLVAEPRISAASPRDIWIVGSADADATAGSLVHYDGSQWAGQQLGTSDLVGVTRMGTSHTFIAANGGPAGSQFRSTLYWLRRGQVLRARRLGNLVALGVAATGSQIWVDGFNDKGRYIVEQCTAGHWFRILLPKGFLDPRAITHVPDSGDTWIVGGIQDIAGDENTLALLQLGTNQ